jgi:crotonobetainyl-CoA:carnitine CoA-transferase CaiB-like acyl-CoA transferase
MSETPGEVRRAGRRIGQDTDEVLREILGFSDERLRELYTSGVTAPEKEVA